MAEPFKNQEEQNHWLRVFYEAPGTDLGTRSKMADEAVLALRERMPDVRFDAAQKLMFDIADARRIAEETRVVVATNGDAIARAVAEVTDANQTCAIAVEQQKALTTVMEEHDATLAKHAKAIDAAMGQAQGALQAVKATDDRLDLLAAASEEKKA